MNVKPGDAKVGILTKDHLSLSVTTMFHHQLSKLFCSVMEPIPQITLLSLSVFPPGTQLWKMGP